MTYESAMEYMHECSKRGSVLGLESMNCLLDRLGRPERKLAIIHVAGTNGKGSVCAYLMSILAEAGYLVGRYNSPAVFEVHENISTMEPRKIEFDSESEKTQEISHNSSKNWEATAISKDEFAAVITQVKEACDEMETSGQPLPTVFEVETAAAILYFAQKSCDLVLLEVGMGGRLDATNAIQCKICSVLTSISMDHWQFLGDTIAKIAYEKAGIIAKNGFVVSAEQPADAIQVIEQVCEERQATLQISNLKRAKNIKHSIRGIKFERTDSMERYDLPLIGVHQVQNAMLAIDTIQVLREQDYRISEDAIKRGLARTVWHGRLERISNSPAIYIDGAHNEGAALALRDSIETYLKGKRLIYIIGIFADKDYRTVLDILLPYSNEIIAIQPNHTRALQAEELVQAIKEEAQKIDTKEEMKIEKRVYNAHDSLHAIEQARQLATTEDVILAFGSLSFLKEIKDAVK